MNARTATIVDGTTKDFVELFDSTLALAQQKLESAEVKLQDAKDQQEIAELRSKASQLNSEIDALSKVFKASMSLDNPIAVIGTLIELDAIWEKADNPFSKAASALDNKRIDRNIAQAYKEIEETRVLVAKLAPGLKSAKRRMKDAQDNSNDHWKLTEQDYDKNPKNKGLFRFSKMPGAIAAAEIVAALCIGAESAADEARKAIVDWSRVAKDPHDWMGDPAEGLRIINAMGGDAGRWWNDALRKRAIAKTKSEQFSDIQVRARLAMGQAPGLD